MIESNLELFRHFLFDSKLSSSERKSLENGIWLCQNCATLIDRDERRYSVSLLNKWKQLSEEAALLEVENIHSHLEDRAMIQKVARLFRNKLEQHMDYLDFCYNMFWDFMNNPLKLRSDLKAKYVENSLRSIRQDEVDKNIRL